MNICPRCKSADLNPGFDTSICLICGAEIHVTKGLLPDREKFLGPERIIEETIQAVEGESNGEVDSSTTQEDTDLEVRWA